MLHLSESQNKNVSISEIFLEDAIFNFSSILILVLETFNLIKKYNHKIMALELFFFSVLKLYQSINCVLNQYEIYYSKVIIFFKFQYF